MASHPQNLELKIFEDELSPKDAGESSLLLSYAKNEFTDILRSDVAQNIYKCVSIEEDCLSTSFQAKLKSLFNESSAKDQFEFNIFIIGLSSLKLFYQSNWNGPLPSVSDVDVFCQDASAEGKDKFREYIRNDLYVDGEFVLSLCKNSWFIWLAKNLLSFLDVIQTRLVTNSLWLIRALMAHQAVIDNPSPTIKERVIEKIHSVSENKELLDHEKHRSLCLQFYCEASGIAFFFFEPKMYQNYLNLALKTSRFEIETTGKLGKRTKFQRTSIAQLVVLIRHLGSGDNVRDSADCSKSIGDMPTDVVLDDDTLLPKIEFDEELPPVRSLSETESAFVLVHGLNTYRNQGMSDISKEEFYAVINFLLDQPINCAVMIHCLYYRCKLENEIFRKKERSLKQFEELISFYKKPQGTGNRTHLLLMSRCPPFWEIKERYAKCVLELGMTKSALEIYQELEMWNEIIECYQSLGLRATGEKLIRDRLAIKETPELYCYLGNVTKDLANYQKSWDLSNHRYGRAQKMWALSLMQDKKFKESLEHFQLTLGLNPLQCSLWFTYGCAAMAAEDLKSAETAFRRSANLENDNFQTWNNLGAVLLKTGQKEKAHTILQEALKHSYENWRVWENFLILSVDLGEIEDCLRAYNRMLDIKDKFVDIEVLKILVRVVKEDLEDAKGLKCGRLKPKVLELFGHVTSKLTNNADIWKLYASLSDEGENTSNDNKQKVLQYLQKSQRCLTQDDSWLKDVEKCILVVKETCDLGKQYTDLALSIDNTVTMIQMLSSAKMMLNGIMMRLKKKFLGISGEIEDEKINKAYKDLEVVRDRIVSIIAEHN